MGTYHQYRQSKMGRRNEKWFVCGELTWKRVVWRRMGKVHYAFVHYDTNNEKYIMTPTTDNKILGNLKLVSLIELYLPLSLFKHLLWKSFKSVATTIFVPQTS